MRDFVPLESCEGVLTVPGELWFRAGRGDEGEIDPGSFQDDEYKVSGARSSKQSARGLFEFLEELHPGAADGVWQLTVQEAADLKSRLVDDTDCPPGLNESVVRGHTYLDLRAFSRQERKNVRELLALAANSHGRRYP